MSEPRTIVHFDLDTFFVSVERLLNSSLIGKPVLVGGVSDRGVVASCSYEARSYGIYSGMSMKIARRMCSEAMVVKGDSSKYGKYSNIITEIIKSKMPLVEKASVDEFYLDMTGMDKVFGIVKYSNELRDYIIRETGLPMSMGMSENKTVSKVATGEAKPNGRLMVDLGREKGFLAPLSIRKLPNVGGKTYDILKELGIERIGTLQQTPRKKIEKLLGKNGETLWHRAQGIDNTPIIPYHERQSLGTERTFHVDTIDASFLRSIIKAMAVQVAYHLRNGNRMCACVSVKIRYSDMQTYSRQVTIPYTSFESIIVNAALSLFDKLFTRRQLVRLVGVQCSKLVVGGHQMNLLDTTSEQIRLLQARDKMGRKYDNPMIITYASIMEHTNLGIMGDAWSGEPNVPPAHRHA